MTTDSRPQHCLVTVLCTDEHPTFEQVEASAAAVPGHRGRIHIILPLRTDAAPPPGEDDEGLSMSVSSDLEIQTRDWLLGVVSRAIFVMMAPEAREAQVSEELLQIKCNSRDEEQMRTAHEQTRRLVAGEFEELSEKEGSEDRPAEG